MSKNRHNITPSSSNAMSFDMENELTNNSVSEKILKISARWQLGILSSEKSSFLHTATTDDGVMCMCCSKNSKKVENSRFSRVHEQNCDITEFKFLFLPTFF